MKLTNAKMRRAASGVLAIGLGFTGWTAGIAAPEQSGSSPVAAAEISNQSDRRPTVTQVNYHKKHWYNNKHWWKRNAPVIGGAGGGALIGGLAGGGTGALVGGAVGGGGGYLYKRLKHDQHHHHAQE